MHKAGSNLPLVGWPVGALQKTGRKGAPYNYPPKHLGGGDRGRGNLKEKHMSPGRREESQTGHKFRDLGRGRLSRQLDAVAGRPRNP